MSRAAVISSAAAKKLHRSNRKGEKVMLFKKFGEFDSADELNRAAAAQLAEGDTEAIIALAEENGLDKEDAEDYIASGGKLPLAPTAFVAATGKIRVEAAELANKVEIIDDWIMYIQLECEKTEGMSEAVRRKGKSLKGCIEKLLKWSLNNAQPVDPEILKACKINYKVTLGIPGGKTAKKLIREYYLEGKR